MAEKKNLSSDTTIIANLENVRGTKDYGPEEQAVRERIMETIKNVFRLYGFNPLETPVLEKYDLLSAKYAGGDEILKETYTLQDQGGRELGMRYDMTVPLARYVAMNPTVKIPFKRYQIGPVFRDGPVKQGRLRQFCQADVDIIGSDSIRADAECVNIALEVFDRLGLDVKIKVNNRKLLNSMVEKAGIKDAEGAILSLDKLEKIGAEGVVEEMKEKGISEEQARKLLELCQGGLEDMEGYDGYEEMIKLLERTDDEKVVFTPSLARGLAYYTGSIYEVFSEEFDSSLAAGGRYDDMIGNFARKDFPAVGISFGVEPIYNLMKGKTESFTKAFIIPIGVREEADKLAAELRAEGINTDIDMTERGISKGLSYADSYNIPYAVMIGEREVEKGEYTLKDMESGEQESLSFEELVERLK